jgi:hypothetical protein
MKSGPIVAAFFNYKKNKLHHAANIFSAAASVLSISASVCAEETNPASNAEGAKYIPAFNIA